MAEILGGFFFLLIFIMLGFALFLLVGFPFNLMFVAWLSSIGSSNTQDTNRTQQRTHQHRCHDPNCERDLYEHGPGGRDPD